MADLRVPLKPAQGRAFMARIQQIQSLTAQINELAEFLLDGTVTTPHAVVGVDDSNPDCLQLVLRPQQDIAPATPE
jgi:hypothetical protein